jgi:hypothetical protein
MENESLSCPVCNTGLTIRLANGRKSGKPFVMLICPKDGRHIRAFISDKKFVEEFLDKLEHKESSHQNISHPTSSKLLQNQFGAR